MFVLNTDFIFLTNFLFLSTTLTLDFAYQTEHCGWGVVAAESINKGDFVIEYVGEGNSCMSKYKSYYWNTQFLFQILTQFSKRVKKFEKLILTTLIS